MLVFFMMNGLLLFRLESYNQIFSSQVRGCIKTIFLFFYSALLIFYFISPKKDAAIPCVSLIVHLLVML